MRSSAVLARSVRELSAALLAACFIFFSSADAQTITGTVLEVGDERPLTSAVVSLLDTRGDVRAQTLTDGRGRFSLRAPEPGRYLVRAERLGWSSAEEGPFELRANETVRRDLVARPDPILLQEIRVEVGTRGCRVGPEEGTQTARLWDQARRVLQAEAVGREGGAHRYRLRNYERQLTPDARRIVTEEQRAGGGYMRDPYASAPVEELMERGWIQVEPEDGAWTYYAPDAAALLSEAFLDGHCFRAIRTANHPGLVGLGFEPLQDLGAPGVEGALWLEEATGRLQFLTFRYTSPPQGFGSTISVPDHAFGGRVEFAELPHGAWVVSRWHIRSPMFRMERQQGAGMFRDRAVIGGVQETGGEVLDVRLRDGEVLGLAATGSLAGIVLDASGTRPVTDATVGLEGTSYRVRPGPDGRFRLGEVPEGIYHLVLEQPMLGALRRRGEPVEVEIRAGDETTMEVQAPSSEEILSQVCSETDEGRGEWLPAVVTGSVVAEGGERSVDGLFVELHHVRVWVDGLWEPAGLGMEWEGSTVTTGPDGSFLLCADPDRGWGRSAEFQWRMVVRGDDGSQLHSEWIEPSEGEILVHTLRVPGTTLGRQIRERVAELSGDPAVDSTRMVARILDAATRDPVVGARVELVGEPASGISGDDGTTVLGTVAPGSYELRVEHGGYGVRSEMVDILGGSGAELEVLLPPDVIALEGLTVTVRSRGAEEGRASGTAGVLFAGAALARAETRGARVIDLLRGAPGVRVMEGRPGPSSPPPGSVCVELSRGLEGLAPQACNMALLVVDGVRISGGMDEAGAYLASLQVAEFESIEILRPVQAGFRYGLGGSVGAIVLHSRGTGPFRDPARDPEHEGDMERN